MAARAGLLASDSGSCDLGLPPSPTSQTSATSLTHRGSEEPHNTTPSKDQVKASLLDWLNTEMRKKFKGLVQEHGGGLY